MPDPTHLFTLAIRPNPSIPIAILHEDPDLLIIDKPAGLVTQPGKGHAHDSLLNALFALHDGAIGKQLHNLGERRDFGLLHRLDKETSGLLVVAKSPSAYDQLRRDFEARNIDKEYYALTANIPHPPRGVIQARLKEVEVPSENPHARRRASIKKAVISRQGHEAITVYKVLNHTGNAPDVTAAALVQLTLKTGRLHQIRAHLTFLNCHVLGDDIYQSTPSPAGMQKSQTQKQKSPYPHPPRLCLHAFHLGFKHPISQKWTHFNSPLPTDLARYAQKLGLTLPEPLN